VHVTDLERGEARAGVEVVGPARLAQPNRPHSTSAAITTSATATIT
jgi:hypothetical protein